MNIPSHAAVGFTGVDKGTAMQSSGVDCFLDNNMSRVGRTIRWYHLKSWIVQRRFFRRDLIKI